MSKQVKQIQLRGISRTPSDRMTADGGLNQSLNFQIEEQESAPILPPRDISDRLLSGAVAQDIKYIHKTTSYENYICLLGNSIGWWKMSSDIPKELESHIWMKDESFVANVFQGQEDNIEIYCWKDRNGLVGGVNENDIEYIIFENSYYQVKGIRGGDNSTVAFNAIGKGMLTPSPRFVSIFDLKQGESFCDINSVGNTLIITTSEQMLYSLYIDGNYKALGNRIPMPIIDFETISNVDEISRSASVDTSSQPLTDEISQLNETAWANAIKGIDENDDKKANISSLYALTELIWGTVTNKINNYKRRGYFYAPVVVRYALRLYDGSHIYQSVPILLGASNTLRSFNIVASKFSGTAGDTAYAAHYNIVFNNIYKAKARLKQWGIADWSDIVDTIDIYLSRDISNPVLGTSITKLQSAGDLTNRSYNILTKGQETEEDEFVRTNILNASNFYLIASFECTNPKRLLEGYDLLSNNDLVLQDILVQQEQLEDDWSLGRYIKASKMLVYNKRLITHGIQYELSSGHHLYNAPVLDPKLLTGESDDRYIFRYHIRDSVGISHTVLSRNLTGGNGIVPTNSYTWDDSEGGGHYTDYPAMMAFICHPDPNCYEVDVWYNGKYRTFPMSTYPLLHCSYWYGGIDKQLKTLIAGADAVAVSEADFCKENILFTDKSVLIMSAAENPFVFPVTGRYHFSGDIVGMATTTKAISTGQFGQFPLYVFTTDGVHAMESDAVGNFITNKPLSRDVAIEGAVFPIDQAVVYVTNKGVMLMQGSDVVNLSSNMNGRHFAIDQSTENVLASTMYAHLIDVLKDSTTFMSFMYSAKAAYDYAGERLIFFKDDEHYAYVYRLATQTWHMLSLDSGLMFKNTLNSYPDAYVSMNDGGVTRLMDYSTALTDEDVAIDSTRRMTSVIITRPFNLDADDVYKSISDIKIRGNHRKGDVKYILLGSNDGENFTLLHSLRGQSWRLYRLVIVGNLKPTDRISWVDVEYDTRFTNKLR